MDWHSTKEPNDDEKKNDSKPETMEIDYALKTEGEAE